MKLRTLELLVDCYRQNSMPSAQQREDLQKVRDELAKARRIAGWKHKEFTLTTETEEEPQMTEQNNLFSVMDYHYSNTGGGCMVSTAKVWLDEQRRIVWFYLNEEGGSVSAGDYIWDEHLDEGNWEQYHIINWEWIEPDANEALNYYKPMIAEILKQHIKNDGNSRFYKAWKSNPEPDDYRDAAAEFKDMMNDTMDKAMNGDDDSALDKFYEMDFIIKFGDEELRLMNNADVFSAIEHALEELVDG